MRLLYTKQLALLFYDVKTKNKLHVLMSSFKFFLQIIPAIIAEMTQTGVCELKLAIVANLQISLECKNASQSWKPGLTKLVLLC